MPWTLVTYLVVLNAGLVTSGNSAHGADGHAPHVEEETVLSGSPTRWDGTEDNSGKLKYYIVILFCLALQECICKGYVVPSMDVFIRKNDLNVRGMQGTSHGQTFVHSFIRWGARISATYGHTAPLMLNNFVACSSWGEVPGLGIGTIMGVNMFNLLLLAGIALIVLKEDVGRVKMECSEFCIEAVFAVLATIAVLICVSPVEIHGVTASKQLNLSSLFWLFSGTVVYVLVDWARTFCSVRPAGTDVVQHGSPPTFGTGFKAQCQILFNSRQANAFESIHGHEPVIIDAMVCGITLEQARSNLQRNHTGEESLFNLDLANGLLSTDKNIIRYSNVSEVVCSGSTVFLHFTIMQPYFFVTLELEMENAAQVSQLIDKIKENAPPGWEEWIYVHEYDPTITGAYNDFWYKCCKQRGSIVTKIWVVLTCGMEFLLASTMGWCDVRTSDNVSKSCNSKTSFVIANAWLMVCSLGIVWSTKQLKESDGTVPAVFGSTFAAFFLSLRHAIAGVLMAESDKAHDVMVSTLRANVQNIWFALVLPWSAWGVVNLATNPDTPWTIDYTHEFVVIEILAVCVPVAYVVVFLSVRANCTGQERPDKSVLEWRRQAGFVLIILYFMCIGSVFGLYYIPGVPGISTGKG